MRDIFFANPEYLLLLLALPLLFIWRYFKRDTWHIQFRILNDESSKPNFFTKILNGLTFLPYIGYILLVLALSRPQKSFSEEKIETEGIDIVLALDVSTSMLAMDLKPNRMEAAKNVAIDFVEKRPNDRMGLVLFAGESFTQCPITTDHSILKNLIDKVKDGLLEDGTAIGMGLGTAVNRLKDSESKSKVIILLSDGVNMSGYIDPMTAAELALNEDIRVYTIGLGRKGTAPYPMRDMFGRKVVQNVDVEIDEALLKKIASKTGGIYYRATNTNKLDKIFDEIDQLEKSKIELLSFERKTDHFRPLLIASMIILLLSFFLNKFLLRPLS